MEAKEEIQFYKDNFLLDNDASFSPFGYAFQADAGLYLFCEYFKDVDSIKIESQLQDIELKKKDGKFILAQAKSSQDPLNCHDFGSKLNNALFSLAKHFVNSDDKLIYVSNIPNLVGEEMSGQFNDTIVSYKHISQHAKDLVKEKFDNIKRKLEAQLLDNSISAKMKIKIQKIKSQIAKFSFDNLYFLSITRYTPDGDARSIKDKISSFLVDDFEINPSIVAGIVNKLFQFWHDQFYLDSEKKDFTYGKSIDKDKFCWPIITINNMERSPDEISEYFDGDYDPSLGEEIKIRFDSFVEKDDYQLINDVLNDYSNYKSKNLDDKAKEFIYDYWPKYVVCFGKQDDMVAKGASIFFLYCLLKDRFLVQKVLRGREQ